MQARYFKLPHGIEITRFYFFDPLYLLKSSSSFTTKMKEAILIICSFVGSVSQNPSQLFSQIQ